MNNQMVTLVFFGGAVLLYLVFLWQERRRVFMYKFYALRDNLYRLAIEERIKEDSTSFKQLTLMLNITIAHSKKFKLKNFIKALEAKKLDRPIENELFFNDLAKQDEEVQKIAEDFFGQFFHLLIRNHPPLFIWIHIRVAMNMVPMVKKQISTALSYKESGEKVRLALAA